MNQEHLKERFEKFNCTYYDYGDQETLQPEYVCEKCDLDHICLQCYNNCHKDCKKKKNETKVQLFKFACKCGKEKLHEIKNKTSSNEVVACNYRQFEQVMMMNETFRCEDHNLNICSICFTKCHSDCKNKSKISQDEKVDCKCTEDTHLHFNLLFLKSTIESSHSSIENKGNFSKLEYDIQIINSIYNSGILKGMEKHLVECFKSLHLENESFIKIVNFVSRNLDSKFKPFFYSPNMIKCFEHFDLMRLIIDFNVKEPKDIFLFVKFVSIFYYFHIKKDFMQIKNLSISDFTTLGSIYERLSYRLFIKTKNIYTETIHDKYNLFESNEKKNLRNIIALNSKKYNLKNLIYKIGESLAKGIDKIDANNIEEFKICFKLISYMLKHMIFELQDLHNLIDSLFEFYPSFMQKLSINSENSLSLFPVFKTFTKIFYLIGVNYNDLIFEESITATKYEIREKTFVHIDNESTEKLIKMAISTVNFIKFYYSDNVWSSDTNFKFPEKLYNECLKLYTIAENIYYQQINYLHNEMTDSQGNSNSMNIYPPHNFQSVEVFKEFFDLKSNMIEILDSYFNFKDYNDPNKKLIKVLQEFNHKVIKLGFSTSINMAPTPTNASKFTNNLNYLQSFETEEKLNVYLDNLAFSSIDDILTKVINLLNTDKVGLTNNEISYILEYLSIFTLTKKGLKYFLSGNNLSRILKLFPVFPQEIIKFVLLIMKKVKLFEIDISFHKILYSLKFALLKFWRTFNSETVLDSTNLLKLTLTFKIVNQIGNFFEFEDYNEIKNAVITLIFKLKQQGFLNYENFKKLFESEESELPVRQGKTNRVDVNFEENVMFEENEEKDKLLHLNKSEKDKLLNNEDNSNKDQNSNSTSFKKKLEVNVQNNVINIYQEESPMNKPYKLSELELMYKFYFNFFQLICKNYNYVFYENEIELKKYNDILAYVEMPIADFFKARSNLMTTRKRKILIRTIRIFYFIDFTNRSSFSNNFQHFSNADYEYVKMFTDEVFIQTLNQIKNNDPTQYNLIYDRISKEDYEKKIVPKYQIILKIQTKIDNFRYEISKLDENYKLFNETLKVTKHKARKVNIFKNYLIELILSIRFIAEFMFLNKNIWNGLVLNFYKLAKDFLIKYEFMLQILNDGVLKSADVFVRNLGYLQDTHFDFTKKDEIFRILSETIDEIFLCSQLALENSFEKTLYIVDKSTNLNFSPFSLIEEDQYNNFYRNSIDAKYKVFSNSKNPSVNLRKIIQSNDIQNPNLSKVIEIKEHYENQLMNFEDSVFIKLLTKKLTKNEVDHDQFIIDYFCNYMCLNLEKVTEENNCFTRNNIYSIICIINKMLFFNLKETQTKLLVLLKEENNQFWKNIKSILQESNMISLIYSKNYFSGRNKLELILIVKEITHFLQLLSEDQFPDFIPKIFSKIELNNNSDSIIECMISDLNWLVDLMDLEYFAGVKLPLDLNIIQIYNIIDFLIEFIQSTDEENFKVICNLMETVIFKNMNQTLFYNIHTSSSNIDKSSLQYELIVHRKKILNYIKYKFLTLITSFMESKHPDISFIIQEYTIPKLYDEIRRNFNSIVSQGIYIKKIDEDLYNFETSRFVKYLRNLYKYQEFFRESPQIMLILKIFHIVKIMTRFYGVKTYREFLEDNNVDLRSAEKPSKHKSNIIDVNHLHFNFILSYKIYSWLRTVLVKVDISDEGKSNTLYFIRPYFTYHLSDETKENFLKHVNRENAYNKLNSLVSETDYFIFEMICNVRSASNRFLTELYQKINFYQMEIINYFIILIHQIILINHFYHHTNVENSVYDTVIDTSNTAQSYIVSFVQIVFLVLVIIAWILLKMPLNFEHNIMQNFKKKFIFRNVLDDPKYETPYNTVKKIFGNDNMKQTEIISRINAKIPNLKLLKAAIGCLIFNREINLLLLTLVLVVLFIIFSSPILIIIPVFFIASFSNTLQDIFVAIRMKYKHLLTVLLYTYLTIYFFSWIGIFWISHLFNYDDSIDPDGNAVTENFCTSSIQCILFMINYGTRNGGGIGDVMPRISYKSNVGMFFGQFFYDLIFYILIILFLGNIFLGIIVDTFADLRDRNTARWEDIKNVCYICQLTRDDSLKNKIDFRVHTKEDHYVWNYVYFLTYLYTSNSNDFNPLESNVWKKLNHCDISWIPLESTRN